MNIFNRTLTLTQDGSYTLKVEEVGEHYHSTHGAMQEADYVFLQQGLCSKYLCGQGQVRILEIGFGSGLNAFMTFLKAQELGIGVHYEGVEAYPLSEIEAMAMNYPDALNCPERADVFGRMHAGKWGEELALSESFTLVKRHQLFEHIADMARFELIYFDAFGARVQPHLWEEPMFARMYDALVEGGVLVTYASKGSARRAMQAVGFEVEKIPGPKGKREMLRAVKKGFDVSYTEM